MYIDSSYSTSGVSYLNKTNEVKTTASTQSTPAEKALANADQVTISDTARQAAYVDKTVPGEKTDASATYPLEMYQVPSWQAEHMFEVSGQLGSGANWFAEKNPQAASVSASERNEYASLAQGFYQAVLDANGIRGVEAHYEATIRDQESSESLRQQMSELMRSDDRFMELMGKMGKSIS